MLFILVLTIVPLIYMYRVFNLNNYIGKVTKTKKSVVHDDVKVTVNNEVVNHEMGIESLKKYEKDIYNLKVLLMLRKR